MRVLAVTQIVDVRAGDVPRTFRFQGPYRRSFHCSGGLVVNRYGERPYRPYALRRNLRLMPAAFFAPIALVVNEAVAARLQVFDGVDLNPCVWETVYDRPVDEASILAAPARHHPFGEEDDEEERWMPPPPGLPKYFEVLAPAIERLPDSLPRDMEFKLPDPAYEELPPLRTSLILHRIYPVVTALPYYLFAEPACNVIEPHVSDPDLFTIRYLDVG